VVSWAAGGGSVSQSPDPAHPDELLLIADRPGNLTITVRVREGMMESRGMKSVTAMPDVTAAPPFTLRLFLHGWGLVVVAVLVAGTVSQAGRSSTGSPSAGSSSARLANVAPSGSDDTRSTSRCPAWCAARVSSRCDRVAGNVVRSR
jgi:hypothetical protein